MPILLFLWEIYCLCQEYGMALDVPHLARLLLEVLLFGHCIHVHWCIVAEEDYQQLLFFHFVGVVLVFLSWSSFVQ